ncbi:SMC-Scp complex subunit ScpB [Candidatus Bipolaricaulota bacterium]
MMTQDQPRNDLALAEAALFLAPQPLTRRALAKILGDVALAYVDQLLEDLKAQFDDSSRGIELHVEEGRALFRVKNIYVNQVAHLAPQQDIPRPILRTLAVIAYNHPMTQADLIKVRGNKGYGHVKELIERHLITGEDHGRTQLLSVTKDFLRHFGLSSVEEFRFHFGALPEEDPESEDNESTNDPSDLGEGAVSRQDSEDEGLEPSPPEVAEDTESLQVDDEADPLPADGEDGSEQEIDEEPSEEVENG